MRRKKPNITRGYALQNIGSDVSSEAVELGRAVENYRTRVARRDLHAAEVLAIAVSLGWRKTALLPPGDSASL
jgi:hypothetical protein